MPSLRMPLRVGEIVSATVKRKITDERVLISLKGHVLVAEPEQSVMPGDEIKVQVLTVFPRVRLRLLNSSLPPPKSGLPLDLRT